MINFYDTSALLIKIPDSYFYISSITLTELENIKTSYSKDYDIKSKARKVSNWLSEHMDNYKVIRYKPFMLDYLPVEMEVNNDAKIIACALSLNTELKIWTNDNNFFLFCTELELTVEKIKAEEQTYTGLKEVNLNDEEMADYYSHLSTNYFNLYEGEYLIIRNLDNEVVDVAAWDGEKMRPLYYDDIVSGAFGRLKPKKGDPYQACLFDSLYHNQVNLITGKPGSGKSLISLAYLFSLLDHKIDRIVIFCNPVVVRNASKLGYYPGSVLEKLLSTQIGNILSSKLGDEMAVQSLVNEGKLVLIPVGDCRGYEVPPSSGVYITEGQNFSVDLLKLILQRCAEDTVVICEGDAHAQVDLEEYLGSNSGIRAMSRAFKGDSQFGQIDLKNIYRSHVAALAEKMDKD